MTFLGKNPIELAHLHEWFRVQKACLFVCVETSRCSQVRTCWLFGSTQHLDHLWGLFHLCILWERLVVTDNIRYWTTCKACYIICVCVCVVFLSVGPRNSSLQTLWVWIGPKIEAIEACFIFCCVRETRRYRQYSVSWIWLDHSWDQSARLVSWCLCLFCRRDSCYRQHSTSYLGFGFKKLWLRLVSFVFFVGETRRCRHYSIFYMLGLGWTKNWDFEACFILCFVLERLVVTDWLRALQLINSIPFIFFFFFGQEKSESTRETEISPVCIFLRFTSPVFCWMAMLFVCLLFFPLSVPALPLSTFSFIHLRPNIWQFPSLNHILFFLWCCLLLFCGVCHFFLFCFFLGFSC